MRTLHNQPVIVTSSDGTPIAFGRFYLIESQYPNTPAHVELAFETDIMSCRVRINEGKVPAIKATWDGTTYKFALPTRDTVWMRQSERPVPPEAEP